jgi:hypothetical protein
MSRFLERTPPYNEMDRLYCDKEGDSECVAELKEEMRWLRETAKSVANGSAGDGRSFLFSFAMKDGWTKKVYERCEWVISHAGVSVQSRWACKSEAFVELAFWAGIGRIESAEVLRGAYDAGWNREAIGEIMDYCNEHIEDPPEAFSGFRDSGVSMEAAEA